MFLPVVECGYWADVPEEEETEVVDLLSLAPVALPPQCHHVNRMRV